MLDYLVVGQGFAGSILAWKMIMRGCRVAVISDSYQKAASFVAAGIINPIAGKRLAKGWEIHKTLPAAKKTYNALESFFSKSFFESRSIIRFYQSIDEHTIIQERILDPEYQPFITLNDRIGMHAPTFGDTLGGLVIHGGGIVAMRELLGVLALFLKEKACLYEEAFDSAHMKIEEEHIVWKNVKAKKIVFCQGWHGARNSWFDWLPFQPAKGELLTVHGHVPIEYSAAILNKGIWLFSMKEGLIKLGATYNRKELSEEVTELAKETLLKSYNALMPGQERFSIVAHETSIRPCTRDTKPFIGIHPLLKQLAIFNGFGSKGALLIPYLADMLIDHMEHGSPLPEDVSINRHWKA